MSKQTGLHPVWLAFVWRIAAIAVIATMIGMATEAVYALGFAALALLVLMVFRTAHLADLSNWIAEPEAREFPQAGGAWGQVLLALARRMRWEAQEIAAVKAESAAFLDAMAALPDGVVLLNGLAQIIWCNPAAERHLGIALKADRGRVITHLVRIPGFTDYFEQSESAEPFTFSSGKNRSVMLGLELVPVGVSQRLLLSFDISDVHNAEIMRRDFVANVSHELRTPLTVVHGFLEHIEGDDLTASERGNFVRLMQDQSNRMLRLVDDLLTLSRLETERTPRREERIDMPALVVRLVDEAKGLSNSKHKFEFTSAPVDLRGDPDELRSAFGNLISNAVRYTPPGGSIQVSWEDHADGPVFSVSDTGIGVAPEAVPRLTERFFRVDKGRSRDTGGTGLGLAIVKHVLIRHQAELRISSEPGEGSAFAVHLPMERRVGGDV